MRKIGRGRSAEVFLDRDADGHEVVRKIFVGEGLSKLVLYVLTGSANPYTWCEPAIRSAVLRRGILSPLVAYWFGGKLRLPRTDGWQWNDEHTAFEIRAELIDGSHVPLRGPLDGDGTDPLPELVGSVMKPLQDHLTDAGFDGLVWQAGRGNPVAASNFMLESSDGTRSWVWIDLESGVPALFALDPFATMRFYLPKSLHHRGWLFDDVDVAKLRRYLTEHRDAMAQAVGEPAVEDALARVDELEPYQRDWKSLPRHRRSITYELSRRRITAEQAEHYSTRPLRWFIRMLRVGLVRGTVKLAAKARKSLRWLWDLDLAGLTRNAARFTFSQRYRAQLARRLVAARVHGWADRKFLDRRAVQRLHEQLRYQEVSSYVTDFGIHLMLKPPIKFLEWVVVPALLVAGYLNMITATVLISTGGMVGRTLYTTGRLAQATVHGQRRPWIALAVGLLPVVGNAAYPAQLLYCGTEKTGELARFIIYDLLAAIGRSVPVWGGADSLTEHFFNRLGDVAVHWLQKPLGSR